MTIVSATAFEWFMSGTVGLTAVYWIAIDGYRLRLALREDRRDLAVRDRIFGSVLGLAIGVIGVAGVALHLSR